MLQVADIARDSVDGAHMADRGVYRIWKGGFPIQGGLENFEIRKHSILRHSGDTSGTVVTAKLHTRWIQFKSGKPYRIRNLFSDK